MKVKVLFFGATADAVGARETEVKLEDDLKASRAFAEIVNNFPALREKFSKTLLFSINEEYAGGDEIISDGDELGIFTAVSGG